jgi:uncharacterized coiled-coil protein SlyX
MRLHISSIHIYECLFQESRANEDKWSVELTTLTMLNAQVLEENRHLKDQLQQMRLLNANKDAKIASLEDKINELSVDVHLQKKSIGELQVKGFVFCMVTFSVCSITICI